MKTIASLVAVMASEILGYWPDKIKANFDIQCHPKEAGHALDPIVLRQVYQILYLMKPQLVKDCVIRELYISDTMGPNLPHYPNHGYYINNSVTLNSNIFHDPDRPDDFVDEHGYAVERAAQTVIHEFGHGYDMNNGDLSSKPEWLKLSGWSKDPKPGLKRLIIQDPGKPPVIGEWFYDPSAGFTRFYAKRNPWDDWADSFAFFVAGLPDKLPKNKQEYFSKLLSKYSR